jgi:hypothetical protein
MSTTGFLTDFSLPEIFQFIEKGQKSGLLRLRALPESQATPSLVHYIWVYQGRVVAAANQLNQQGLISLIVQTLEVSDRLITKIAQFCPSGLPLGLYLKNQFVLENEQLEHVFQVQISQHVCGLFQLKDGQFKFDQDAPIPAREMTGLGVPATLLNRYGFLNFLSWEFDQYCSKEPYKNNSFVWHPRLVVTSQ